MQFMADTGGKRRFANSITARKDHDYFRVWCIEVCQFITDYRIEIRNDARVEPCGAVCTIMPGYVVHNFTVAQAYACYAFDMKQRLHVIYVAGIGDHAMLGQRAVVASWRLWGVDAEAVPMLWAVNETWEAKFDRLLQRIDDCASKGQPVALVGVSAGATAVINAFAARKAVVVGCALIAAKVNHPETIGEQYNREAPAFIPAAYGCEAALETLSDTDRARILSRYSRLDSVVTTADSHVAGATNRELAISGHTLTIATQIIFAAPFFLRFLRRCMR